MATIQWYPGHMNKARNQLEDKLEVTELVKGSKANNL